MEYENFVLPLLTPQDDEKEVERKIAWFTRFPLRERLEIGYKHTLSPIKFSRLKRVKTGLRRKDGE